ncbi:TetR/AcrR family transcriptional regulator [Sphingomonas sp. KC8]|uniref:TetR/AcrR family transcriptional regulator n=1 Tax=Sphingomonas sp. KC8 TaxID=1030157 RepID=UPI0005646AED|nr:TetR/AcrR family transcriptional regulator [Sphingomonas sp. KC8]
MPKSTAPDVGWRKNPKQQRAVITAEALTEATRQIIVREGFKNATTNRIAEVAGVSVGSLYQYFPNKQAIVKALIEETVSSAATRIRVCLRELMDAPLEPALHQIFKLLFEIYKENYFILFDIVDEIPEMREYSKSISIGIYTNSTNVAFLEQHAHELSVTDLRSALMIVEQATIRNMQHFITENPTNLTEDQLIDELTKMAVNYLTK